MTTGLVWDERYAWHDAGLLPVGPASEPLPSYDTPATKRRLFSLIEASGLGKHLVPLAPRPAEDAELLRIHSGEYLARVRRASEAGGGWVGQNAWSGPGSDHIGRLAVGGCMIAVDAVLEGRVANVYASVRPAGHHATADAGRGYCIFANVALAVLHGKSVHGLKRVAVIDWDVHHGNGTQDALWSDPEVLTISLHQDRHFLPDSGGHDKIGVGRGRGYNLNLPLPPGTVPISPPSSGWWCRLFGDFAPS